MPSSTRRRGDPLDLRLAIGSRLATLRRESGQTQEEVALHLGRRKSWLAKLERGQRSLLFSEALALADAYGVSVVALWPEVPTPTAD